MELRFDLADDNVRAFVAALHCLAQVGRELTWEVEGTSGVTCRALNDAHSASAKVTFDKSFFQHIELVHSDTSIRTFPLGAQPCVKCRVFSRSSVNVFRTLKHVRQVQIIFVLDERSIDPDVRPGDSLEINIECKELVWKLDCDYGITKTHRMKVQDADVMRAVFDRSSCPHRISTRQYHWSSLLAHIQHTSEVAVTCEPTHVKFESYFPSVSNGPSHLHTETTVESAEFTDYVMPSTGSVPTVQLIFCLKEVRALLAFCKASDILEVHFYYVTGGSPVLFAAESTSEAKLDVEVTLSTVSLDAHIPSQSQSEQEVVYASGSGMGSSASAYWLDETERPVSTTQRYLTHEPTSDD